MNGRRIFYDVNANSNLRKPIGEAFGSTRSIAWRNGWTLRLRDVRRLEE
jgi:hypothetical protein